jgi:hypothetical protein
MGFIERDQSSNKHFGDGPRLHECCRLSTMTIASFLCCRSDTSPNVCKKVHFAVFLASKCLDSGHGNSTDTHKGCRGVF